jgi:hypothetical protein
MISVLEEIDDSPLLFDLKSCRCIYGPNFQHDRLDVPQPTTGPVDYWVPGFLIGVTNC